MERIEFKLALFLFHPTPPIYEDVAFLIEQRSSDYITFRFRKVLRCVLLQKYFLSIRTLIASEYKTNISYIIEHLNFIQMLQVATHIF